MPPFQLDPYCFAFEQPITRVVRIAPRMVRSRGSVSSLGGIERRGGCRPWLFAVVFALLAVGLAACGGGHHSAPQPAENGVPNSASAGRQAQCQPAQVQGADVPPIGAPVDTLTSKYSVRINGKDYGPGQALGAELLIVDRCTLAVQSFHYTEFGRDVDAIASKIKDLNSNSSLVILQYPIGLSASDNELKRFNETVLGVLGAPPINRNQADREFTVIGGNRWPQGAAFHNYGRTPVARQAGSLSGYLRLNPATERYDFLFADYVPYSTSARSQGTKENTVQIGTDRISDALPSASSAGFQVVALDGVSLHVDSHEAIPTTTSAGSPDLAGQQRLESVLHALGSNSNRLVIVQSIGNPGGKARTPAWAAVARELVTLGGTSAIFNALDGTGGYALVGRVGMNAPPAEASEPLTHQPGRLQGALARSQGSDMDPLLAGASADTNTGLLAIVYEPGRSFPAFLPSDRAAQSKQAETYIGTHIMRVCPETATSCDIRARYYLKYNEQDWHNALSKLIAKSEFPCPNGPGFTVADCDAVRSQLIKEVSDLNDVQHYLGELQKPFGSAQAGAQVDLNAVAGDVQRSIEAPGEHQVNVNPFQAMSLIFKLGSIAPPPASGLFSGISAGFGLAAYFMRADNSPNLLGPKVAERASALGEQMFSRFLAASTEFDTIGKIVVSNYGKLTDMTNKIHDDPAWELPNLAKVVDTIRKGSRQFFYQSLLPVAYPLAVRINPAPPAGPTEASGYTCFSSFGQSNGQHPNTSSPFRNEPPSGQDRQIIDFRADGTPIEPVFALASNLRENPFPGPASRVTDRAIGPDVGFAKPQLYSPRYFDFSKSVQNDARCPFG